MGYVDAHCHLQLSPIAENQDAVFNEMAREGVTCAVVNGTREADWADVERLAGKYPFLIPSYGLHPWHAGEGGESWLENLERLVAGGRCGVGETGLDKWVREPAIERQTPVFEAQVDLAARFDRPLSIHCLKSWGPLLDILQASSLPTRGFLMHAFGGSRETMETLAGMGAYFSFNAYFLKARKHAQLDVYRHIPPDRLLVETDAPSMCAPLSERGYKRGLWANANHPANLPLAYVALAGLRGWTLDETVSTVSRNFSSIFGAIADDTGNASPAPVSGS